MSNSVNWLDQQNATREDYKSEETYQRKASWKDFLCQEKALGWLFIALVALCPILVYYLIVDMGTFNGQDLYTCLVNETFRVPCGRRNFTEQECFQVDCCYDVNKELCYHSVPSTYYYESDGDYFVASHKKTPIGIVSTTRLHISVDEVSADTVRIILHGANDTVPINTLAKKNYKVNVKEKKLQVDVYRNNAEQDRLLSTATGPLIVSENYLEWTVYLTNHSLFGLDRTLITLEGNSTFTKVIYNNKNDHYSVPVFWAYYAGKFHGIQVRHEGPLEIEILPSFLVVLRSLTGGTIELVVSVGPTPKNLHDQQATPGPTVPFWLMGTHICRNSDNPNITEIIEQFTLEAYADSYCIDENILMALIADNLTNVNIIDSILTTLSEQGKKFLFSVPPQLPENSGSLYTKGASLDLFYRLNGEIYKGMYRNTSVVYPDFSHSDIAKYLEEFDKFISNYIHINIDGFVLKDNWPVDNMYVMKDKSSFPYFTKEMQEVMSNTIPWNATVNNISHIHKHNAYGRSQTTAFEQYYNRSDRRTMLLSSAKMFGQTQSVATIQNVDASWDNLRQFIDNLLFSSITGNHLVSVPICGDTAAFDSDRQTTLCIRWYLVASTMPFLRVYSTPPWRDPASLNSTFATKIVNAAIDRRLALLQYYYTILDRNEPLVRPMFYDYSEDVSTFSMKSQYMIGDSILVAHPLSKNRKKMQVYLPPKVAVWYEMWGGLAYTSNATHNYTEINVVETDLVVFVAQGTIIPLKVENAINLIVALNCIAEACVSTGTLLLDSLVSFTANNSAVTIVDMPISNCNYTLGYIQLYFTGEMLRDHYYTKNQNMCDKGNTFTINYEENETNTFADTTTTTVL